MNISDVGGCKSPLAICLGGIMNDDIKRGLGDNSINKDVIDNYRTWSKIIDKVSKDLLRISRRIGVVQDMHKASHGHEYYFADEQSNVKDCERYPATSPEFGLTRKCTPYEKKEFAGKANYDLEKLNGEIIDNYGRLGDIKHLLDMEIVKGGDDE